MDEMVLKVQSWLNKTYENHSQFNRVTEDGITGWGTIYGLRRALQIEEQLPTLSNSFGPSTYSKCPDVNEGETGNLVYIVQGGLWCKGYSPGGFTGTYGSGTASAVKKFKAATGIGGNGNMNKDFMRALLDMSAFTILSNGLESIRAVQQQLNRDYYNYYQIGPCNGIYDRDMNKMLIYALQKELGIAKASATGTWGPTTVSKCKEKVFNIGSSDNIVKLIRYALVCNGHNVNISSSIYDSTINYTCNKFAKSMAIEKSSNSIGYGVIRSLLSSNGDTSRSAIGCDTATKLTPLQIQTLKNNGYQYVGRYVSNTPGGTLDKALTTTEISNILNAGLKLFLIFQESGNKASNFTAATGLKNGKTALAAVKKLGYTHGANVYFAVDFDATAAEIKNNIIPYFKGVLSSFNTRNYYVGLYGTRNVCTSVSGAYSEIKNYFVSDASYGFSGNLGFAMPSGWSFDQFATDITIGSGEGKVSIDKVAVSGVDNCRYKPNSDSQDDFVLNISEADKKRKGALRVNSSKSGLRVYRTASYPAHLGSNFCLPADLITTIPQNAMYVFLPEYKPDSDYFYKDSVNVVKFLDEDNLETYGYILTNYGDGSGEVNLTQEHEENIKIFEDQQNFENFTVSEDGNDLVHAQRETIEGTICSIYSLRYETKVYGSDGSYLFTLQPGRKIALSNSNTGAKNNKLVAIFRMETDGKWVKPLGYESTSYIEYQLEKGCMPNNRLLVRY